MTGWAGGGRCWLSLLVSVAFVVAGRASPVVDDQRDADQGEQHPQRQEKGRLQERNMGYFKCTRHFPHVPEGRVERSAPSSVPHGVWSSLQPRLNFADSSKLGERGPARTGKQQTALVLGVSYSGFWVTLGVSMAQMTESPV